MSKKECKVTIKKVITPCKMPYDDDFDFTSYETNKQKYRVVARVKTSNID